MSHWQYDTVIGAEEPKLDKLGNTPPVEIEKKDEDHKPTRRELREEERKKKYGVAVSPPDRKRGHDIGANEPPAADKWENDEKNNPVFIPERAKHAPIDHSLGGGTRQLDGRRQYDRRSGTGYSDNKKKVSQGWGHLTEAEMQAALDRMDPRDPAAADGPHRAGDETPEDNSDLKTLDEYKASVKQHRLPEKWGPKEPRAPITDIPQNAIPIHGGHEDVAGR